MVILPSLQQLRFLCALAEQCHFGRAAESCAVTQSTLSGGIKELEARLGVALFERSHRHVMLTPLGKETATRAQRLLVDAEELVGWARNAQEPLSGPLRFGIIPTVGPYVLPSLLSHLGTALPKLKLYVREAPTAVLLDKLAGGELDILLVAIPYELGDVEAMEIAKDPIVVAMPRNHPLGHHKVVIGRAFGKQSSSIYFLVAPHGGIRPAERRRSRLALTLAEREVISRGVTAHQSARSIARLLGRSPSTVSREMSRNGGYDRYRAALADENAWARARRPKCCKLANSPRLRRTVAGKLRLDWSPEQIAGWLKRTHPEDECNQVSHETIYRSLFVQTRGVLKKELLSHLRSKRSMRRSRPVDPNGDKRGHIKDIVSIRQRP